MSSGEQSAGRPQGRSRLAKIACIAGALAVLPAAPASWVIAQQKDPPPENSAGGKSNSAGQESGTVTIHIEVTAGDKNKPVEAASVYVRYTQPHKLRHDQKVEMNVKTTPQGKARVPYVPKGTVVIQVIAEGWKTFGQNFQITEDEQVIKIHLEKPHKWY